MKNTCTLFLVFTTIFSFADDGKKAISTASPLSPLIEDGNQLLSKGQFNAAQAVWQKILEAEPSNANANFKMGMCYYNSIDESPRALPYLRKAINNTVDGYDFFNTEEKNAPNDAFYFLGEIYLASNQPDSAIAMFFKYEDKYAGNPPISVDRQIRNCINAKNAISNPRDVTMKNPGKNINSSYTETNPVLTIDNSVMFFASRRANADAGKQLSPVTGKFDMDIYYSLKDAKGNWDVAAPFKWNTLADEAPMYISADGLTLYFRKDIKGQSDIYMCQYIDKVWNTPKPVSEINSNANETGLSISADGKYLYFCSDREGGSGHYDIYQCIRNGNKWGSPKNLGAVLNTSFNETSTYINPNGKTLFFASNGYRDGMGGYDIFYSEMKEDGSWSTPQNMGYPINTVRDDINFYITGGGTRYYATVREDFDSYDIFKIEGGGFSVENIDVTGQVVTLTQEMSVSDVVEVNKVVEKEVEVVETIETTVEVIKEVQTIDVEREQRMMDSLMAVARLEAKMDPAIVQAQAEKAKAEAEKIKAEAAKVAAEAELKKAEADKAKAEASIARSHADSALFMMRKSVADSVIARAEEKKADAEKAKAEKITARIFRKKAKEKAKVAEADIAKAAVEKIKVTATQVEAEAQKAQAEAVIAEAEKSKADAERAKAEAQLSAAQKAVADSAKAKYDADKAKADVLKAEAQIKIEQAAAEKAKQEAVIAAAQKSKDDVAKAKLEAETASAEKVKAAEESKAEKFAADKAASEASKALADKAREEVRLKTEQAAADKAKADAEKAEANAKLAQANAEKAASEAATKKAQAEIATAEKSKAEAEKANSEAQKAQAISDKAKADVEKAKVDLEKAKTIAESKKTELEKAKVDLELKKQEKTGGARHNPNEVK